MSSVVPDDAPRPRLCHVKRWSDFNGYGFNLHAEKGKSGQFIGKVDEGSPADFAGLKEGDRIVEVNGTNIGNENHQQVVQRVKAVSGETKLLVVDAETDAYYKEMKIVVRGDMPNVSSRVAPDQSPSSAPLENNAESPSLPDSHVSSANEITAPAQHARLCVMKIWPDFQGYGFNLHAERNKPGQFIGNIDPDSPAELAGLKEKDRILEVNGESVSGDSHAGVVTKVKSIPNQTSLLVLDPEADEYFKNNGITVSGDSSTYIKRIECPDRSGSAAAVVSPTPIVNGDASPPSKPRLVQIKIWSDYDGYGFNMHCIKGRDGEFIGKVESGSPADVAGLQEGDRVIEVNGDNIEKDNHVDVVKRIKAVRNVTKLLVVDAELDKHYAGRGIVPTSTMADVQYLACPDDKPTANGTAIAKVEVANHEPEPVETFTPPPPEDETRKEPEPVKATLAPAPVAAAPTPAPVQPPSPAKSSPPVRVDGMEFPLSAAEARERMSRRKKQDPRQSTMSAKEKYDLFQKL